ncbi:hypothetical protein SKAU_G00056600 [Synaphobranchus kaupii]|uniref:Uncharacterized protein n=1 Tax=Synaphobranchus kaupii TaxID=118154 RepID=A0A9Q1G5F8_SYNKA|nr:hypothetical protein SKAU_G00056600 [Synaphobranchus kaupii]
MRAVQIASVSVTDGRLSNSEMNQGCSFHRELFADALQGHTLPPAFFQSPPYFHSCRGEVLMSAPWQRIVLILRLRDFLINFSLLSLLHFIIMIKDVIKSFVG